MKREDSAEYKKTEIEVIMTDAQDPLSSPIKMNKCGRPRTSKNSIIPHPKSIISQTLYAERKKMNGIKCLKEEARLKEEISCFNAPKLEPKIEPVSLYHEIPKINVDNNCQSDSMSSLNKHVSALNIMQTLIKKEEIESTGNILEEQFNENDNVDSFTNCDDNSSLDNFVLGKSEKHSKKIKLKERKHSTKKKVSPIQKVKVKHAKEPLKCTYEGCSYLSRFMSTLKVHIVKKHIGEKPVSCELCSYKCYHKGELRKHLVTHSKESPYVCDYPDCNYSCKISSNLKKHKRIHTGERPYICEQCTFRSNFISSLKAHKRVHTNERPFCCECCGYRSNNASNLKKHFLQKHPNKPYILLKISAND